ncbi:hypothetical protein C5167_031109, partial [Papaver somniferum]
MNVFHFLAFPHFKASNDKPQSSSFSSSDSTLYFALIASHNSTPTSAHKRFPSFWFPAAVGRKPRRVWNQTLPTQLPSQSYWKAGCSNSETDEDVDSQTQSHSTYQFSCTLPVTDLKTLRTVSKRAFAGWAEGLSTAENQKTSCILPSYLDPEKGNYMVMMFKATEKLDAQTVKQMRMPRYGVPDIVNGMTSMRSDKKKHTNGAANCTVSRSTASSKEAQDGQLPNPTLPTNLALLSQLLISNC